MKKIILVAVMASCFNAQAEYRFQNDDGAGFEDYFVFNESQSKNIKTMQVKVNITNKIIGDKFEWLEWKQINCDTKTLRNGGSGKSPKWEDWQDIFTGFSPSNEKIAVYVCNTEFKKQKPPK